MEINQLNKRASQVELLLLDVDGVLTAGEMFYDSSGRELKCFNVYDGLGVSFAVKHGLEIAILTAKESKVVKIRAKHMGIKDVFSGWPKKDVFSKILNKYKIGADKVCFVGDDLIDLDVLKQVGLPIAVNNAVEEVKKISFYTTNNSGGRGAVREVVEIILKAKGIWDKIVF